MFWHPRGWQKLESFINDPKWCHIEGGSGEIFFIKADFHSNYFYFEWGNFFTLWTLNGKDREIALKPGKTLAAPVSYSTMKNSLEPTQENTLAGNKIFNTTAKPIPCVVCHGIKADGLGLIYQQLKPYSRNFTCYQTMKDISDGQLFWVHSKRIPWNPDAGLCEVGR